MTWITFFWTIWTIWTMRWWQYQWWWLIYTIFITIYILLYPFYFFSFSLSFLPLFIRSSLFLSLILFSELERFGRGTRVCQQHATSISSTAASPFMYTHTLDSLFSLFSLHTFCGAQSDRNQAANSTVCVCNCARQSITKDLKNLSFCVVVVVSRKKNKIYRFLNKNFGL